MLRAGLFLGCAVLCGCGSTDASPSSGTGGGSAGGASAAAGASHGGSAGTLNAGGASLDGGGSDSGGNNGAGAANAGGGTAGGDASVACNTFPNAAPPIEETVMKGEPPAPVGGTITDGTYYETSYVVYTGFGSAKPSATRHQLTVQISGSTFQAVFLDDTNTEQRITLQLIPNGTMLHEHQTCRTNTKFMMNDLNVLGYDATPTTFTIHQLEDTQTSSYAVQTLTKQ